MYAVWGRRLLVLCLAAWGGLGCTRLLSRDEGFRPPRAIDPGAIALPEGYRIELVARDLTFPTGVTFDEQGRPYVVEAGYSYGEAWTTSRLLRVEHEGRLTEIVRGERSGPWTGVTYHEGSFYIAQGGQLQGGRIVRVTGDGRMAALIEGLPGMGDHHTNGPVVGPDGWIYFGQGTATNSAVVGRDNFQFGWLKRFPEFHDTPGQDITLRGVNYRSENPFKPGGGEAVTGAFVPFGTPTTAGQRIAAALPCTGAVMRVRPNGNQLELVAWGFRNPFGLAFSPDGKLYVTDNMYDDRGSRPVQGAGDLLWEIQPGVTWYGWPDFHGGRPVNAGDLYRGTFESPPRLLLAERPNQPPEPVVMLAVHSSSDGLDFSRNPAFGYVGEAFIAQLGDETPTTGKTYGPVGFKVVRVNVREGTIYDFAVNKGKKNGPASTLESGGLERPVAARFDPAGTALYVVDFGVLIHQDGGAQPVQGTGVLWRITRAPAEGGAGQ